MLGARTICLFAGASLLMGGGSAAAQTVPQHTAAGATISNTAQVSYTDPGNVVHTIPSNTVDIKVDELVDVNVTLDDPNAVIVRPGAQDQILRYTVTNTGNGLETFSLTVTNATGDQFDPTGVQIVQDVDSDGIYTPGTDILLTAGSFSLTLAAETSARILVIGDIPAPPTDNQTGVLTLTAAAQTGTGAPGKAYPGEGTDGVTAVLGQSGGDSEANGTYQVSSATVAFTKSSSILDPFGGSKPLPGAVITYTLDTIVTGSAPVTNVVVTDAIPTGTTYVSDSLKLDGAALSDADDTDQGRVDASGVRVALPTVAGGTSPRVTFQVTIN